MNNYNFLEFLKWYFKLTTNMFFVEPSECRRGTISKKERLPLIIISYLVFIGSWGILFLPMSGKVWLFGLVVIIPILWLYVNKFSFLYYLLIYGKYKTLNRSLNDKAIVYEYIFLKSDKSVRSTISKYYKVVYTTGNIFCLKYRLVDRSSSKDSKNYFILKITPKKIILNHKVISEKSIMDITELDELLKNNIIVANP